MANSYVTYTGDGSTDSFAVPFPYLNQSHVKAYIDGEETVNFSWTSPSEVEFFTAPGSDAEIRIARETPVTPLVTFDAGSRGRSSTMNTFRDQILYLAEESVDYNALAATSATEAVASEIAAGVSADNASDSEDAAASSASDASDSADAAASSATNADSSAAAAEGYANDTEGDAQAAAASASTAAGHASTASDDADDAAMFASAASEDADDASDSAIAAADSETNAATSASDASDAETKAAEWATQDEDVEVETGQFSAYHWAQKAETIVDGESVLGPASSTVDNLAAWDSSNGSLLKDSGVPTNDLARLGEENTFTEDMTLHGGLDMEAGTDWFTLNPVSDDRVFIGSNMRLSLFADPDGGSVLDLYPDGVAVLEADTYIEGGLTVNGVPITGGGGSGGSSNGVLVVPDWATILDEDVSSSITTIQTLGNRSPGDGGGAIYHRVTSEPSHGMSVQSDDGAWWEFAPENNRINLRQAGAAGDGVENDLDGVQRALDYSADHPGIVVEVPVGTFLVDTDGGGLQVYDGLTLEGFGRESKFQLYEETTQGDDKVDETLFTAGDRTFESSVIKDLTFRNFAVHGMWAEAGSEDKQGTARFFRLRKVANVVMEDLYMTHSRAMSVFCSGVHGFRATRCVLEDNRRDGFNLQDAFDVFITDNIFRGNRDDAVHVDQQGNDFDERVPPPGGSVHISGNTLVNSLGFHLNGCKRAFITNNIFERCTNQPIRVGVLSGHGNTASLAIKVTDNIITDFISGEVHNEGGDGDRCIGIELPDVDEGDGSAVPGLPNTAGSIRDPFDHYYTMEQTTDPDVPVPHSGWIDVSRNRIMRTLPEVSNYSDWGYGPMFTGVGIIDPEITKEDLMNQGIVIKGSARHVHIRDNHIASVLFGIKYIGGNSTRNLNADRVYIEGNHIQDWIDGGIMFENFNDAAHHRIIVRNNEADGDPYHHHPQRLAFGRWNNTALGSFLHIDNVPGLEVVGNRARNCPRIYFGPDDTEYYSHGNIAYCDPVATGYNSGNKGIGNIPTANSVGWDYIIEGSDPDEPGEYGQVLNWCKDYNTDTPTTGKWVQGQFVRNVSTSIPNRIGWRRLTTSANNTGSDWNGMTA